LLAFLLLLVWTGCGGGGNDLSVTLNATPDIAVSGESTTLEWSSHNATRVVSSNFGAATVNGSTQVSPTGMTTYTITVGDGDHTATASLSLPYAPAEPVAGANPSEPFYVQTSNYFNEYTSQTAPFPTNYQMASELYPVPVSYETISTPPGGFDLKTEGERAVTKLAEADPRICILSGVAPANARIKTSLVDSISYNNQNNIIGLTRVSMVNGTPYYDVSVVTIDPANGGPMPYYEIQRTLTHEYGHAFGLGHAPDTRDLMYYRSNEDQGGTPDTFVTYGDATALWTTLCARLVNWYPERDTIVQAGAPVIRSDAGFRHKHVTDEDGTIVCVYPR